ncbi:hypothetical protein K4K59_007771 [Colletotrichum sp. SAR11_240]|nr:hypothetical protein K4K59_007771 [Colletotrichum sp. SAR11_240]
MTNLRRLPPELKIAVVDFLFLPGWLGNDSKEQDVIIKALAALSLSDRFFNLIAEPKLYDLGPLRHPYLLCWATDVGYVNAMRKILSSSRGYAQTGVIRYRPQDTYKEWNRDTESAKQRFDQRYRTDAKAFQRRAHWLDKGDFGEHQELVADYRDGVDEEDDDDYEEDDELLWRRFEAEDFGVVRWENNDFDDFDILNEPKAVYWFPVHIAARQGNMEALALLVDFGALLNIPSKGFCVHASDPFNRSCLHFPDWTDGFDPAVMHPAWTPYHIALCRGHQEMTRYILETCPHISERLLFDGDEITEPIPRFISAMRHSYPTIAEFCLQSQLDDIEEMHADVFDGTLLWRAFWELENFESALEMLLRHGADLEHDLGVGHTLLVEACYHGYYREALALIEAGANADTVLHEPGLNKNLDEAMRTRNHYSFNASNVLDICCNVYPSWLWNVPVSIPSCDAALAVVSHIIDSGVDNETKNTALLFACAFHRVEIIDFLLKSGGDLHDPNVNSVGALTHAAQHSPEWGPGLRTWSENLVQTFSIIINHAKKTGTQLADGVTVAKMLQELCVTVRADEKVVPCIADAILLLVSEGLVDVNHRFGNQTLIIKAMGLRTYQLARGLLDLGADVVVDDTRDDLAVLWSKAFGREPRDQECNNKMYQLLVEIDVASRIFREPYFLASAMSSYARAIVDQMEPRVQLDKDWVNEGGGLNSIEGLTTDDQINHYGWSLLHFAAYYDHWEICRRLVAMEATIHVPAYSGETPLSLSIRSRQMQNSERITELFMAGESKLDEDIAIQYHLIADKAISHGLWSTVAGILAISPTKGYSAIDGPLLLHSIVDCYFSHCFSHDHVISLTIHNDIIHSGVDVNATDQYGKTALELLLEETMHLINQETLPRRLDTFATRLLTSLIMSGAKPSQKVLSMMEAMRSWKDDPWEVVGVLQTTLLYHVMLYRWSIGLRPSPFE